jgi:hypothetical protein
MFERAAPPASGERPPARQAADGALIQRDPIFNAVAAGGTGEVKAMTPEEIAALNLDVGAELRRLAGNAVTRAAQQFDQGCNQVKKELEAAARQQAQLIALAVDIMTGFAAPGLTSILTAKAAEASAVRKLLVDTGKIRNLTAAHSAALDNLDNIEKLKAIGAGVNPSFVEKVSGDNLKATFTAVGKIGSETIKAVAPSKLTGPAANIVGALSSSVAAAAQDIDRSLAGKSNEELFALIIALDASVANSNTYAAQIHRFLTEVMPIGATTGNEFGSSTTSLVKMNAYGGPRLAVVETGTSGVVFGTPFSEFVAWIAPSMEESALARAGLKLDQVPVFNPDKLSSLPAPASTADSRILP